MSTPTPTWSTRVDQRAESVTMVPLSRIRTAADNPRKDVGDVSELAESIKQNGIIEPLILTHGPDAGDQYYVIVAGHRRMAAVEKIVKEEPGRLGSVQRRQLAHVPAIIRTYDEQARTVVSLVENLQRSDLTPLEEAAGYQRLEAAGLSQRAIAEQVGKAQSHVQKRLSLLELPAPALKALDSGGITIGAALELTKLKDHPQRVAQVVREVEEGEHVDAQDIQYAVANEIREAKREAAYAKSNAELQSRKIKVLGASNRGGWNGWFTHGMKDLPLKGQGRDAAAQMAIGVKEHERWDCHAARIDSDGKVVYVCTTPANHAKADKKAAELSREAKRHQAEQTRRRNEEKERKAGIEARLEVLKKIAAAPSKEWVQYAAVRLGETTRTEEGRVAVEVLGLTPPKGKYGSPEYGLTLAKEALRSQRSAESVLIALAFGNIEPRIRNAYYPGYGGRLDTEGREYLRLLQKAGYKPSPGDQKLLQAKLPAEDRCRTCGGSLDEALDKAMSQLADEVVDAYEERTAKDRKVCINCWTAANPDALTAGADNAGGGEEDGDDE